MLKYMCLVSRLSHESHCPLSLLWACAGVEQHPGGASSNSCSNAEYNEWLNMLLTGVSAMIVLHIANHSGVSNSTACVVYICYSLKNAEVRLLNNRRARG